MLPSLPISTFMLEYWVGPAVALLVTLALTPFVIRIAHAKGWVAHPKEDRWHTQPTALMGGVGIAAGTFAGWFFLDVPGWLFLGAALLFAAGVIDDRIELKPLTKLIIQVVAASLPLLAGYTFGQGVLLWFSVPVTLLWMIGVTNAVNLIDGMDGLAAGLSGIAALVLGAIALVQGDIGIAFAAFVLAAACVGFLVYNFYPARIFMGDGGSLLLGYILASLSLLVQDAAPGLMSKAVALAVPILVLAIPIADTTLVTFMRIAHRRPVTQGGNDHIMHRLAFMGLSERRTVVVLYVVSALLGGLAILLHLSPGFLMFSLTAFVLVLATSAVVFVGSADVYSHRELYVDPVERHEANLFSRFALEILGREWKALMGFVADVLLVGASFWMAHELRFEGGPSEIQQTYILQALPYAILVKVAIFWMFHLYRGIWRYAGTPEVVRIGLATITSSLVLFGVLWLLFPIPPLSTAALIIDWMMTTLGVAGVRLGLRGTRQMVQVKTRKGKRPAILYGAGDLGLISLRELRQNPEYGFWPIAFVDDDPLKQGMVVQGIRVVGNQTRLRDQVRDLDADLVLITSNRMTEARRSEIAALCAEIGVECRVFSLRFDPLTEVSSSLRSLEK